MRNIAQLVLVRIPVLALVVLAASCSNTITSPSDNGGSSTVIINVYAGPLDPGGSTNFIETLDSDSTLQVMLAGEQLENPLRTASIPLRLEIANWDGSLCTPLDTNVTAPRLTAQLQRYLTAGTYCIRLSDPGTLTEPIGTILRVSYPAPKFLPGTASPVTFASTITPGGRASKTFVTSAEGDIAITLDSLGGPAGTEAGLGIGVLGSDASSTCTMTRLVHTTPGSGPQIVEHADAGVYCAVLLDVGQITSAQDFSLTIAHP
jgi:hypothetical protein